MATQQVILDVIAKHAQCEAAKLSPSDELAHIGVNSHKFIMLMLEIERVSGRKVFNINMIGKLKTVGDILALAHS